MKLRFYAALNPNPEMLIYALVALRRALERKISLPKFIVSIIAAGKNFR